MPGVCVGAGDSNSGYYMYVAYGQWIQLEIIIVSELVCFSRTNIPLICGSKFNDTKMIHGWMTQLPEL